MYRLSPRWVTADLVLSSFPATMNLKQAFPLLAISLAILSPFVSSVEETLSKFITHFEPLNYDTKAVHETHKSAVSRGLDYLMQFDAFGLRHKLRLKKDDKLFTPDAVIEDGNGNPIAIDHNSFITGEIVGEPGSKVHGVVEHGRFRGKIIGREGNFYVEPAKRYLDDADFHSVIYREADVKYDANYADITKRLPKLSERKRREADSESGERSRRASEEQKKNNVCKLKLFADDRFARRFGGKAEAASKIVEHVAAVKSIYLRDFNKTTLELFSPYGITFRVKQIIVYDHGTIPEKYKPDNLGIDPMLDLLSQENHDDVCEAFLFTDRDFEGGILGLAWIGNPSSVGGVCSKHKQGGDKSYNTGIVTTKLYGRFTPPKVSEVTFAHELGHGFGSQHDPDGGCSPGGTDGNYIMYSKATPGDRENNNHFSSCSLNAIRKNVNVKRSDAYYKDCFSMGNEPICGNRIIEGSEQCDCGDAISCKEEGNCCNAPKTPNECRLRAGAITCSLSQGKFCSMMVSVHIN
ncbi:hypothetical protein QZH41_019619 [Actinostola sp. cb2023]|nr:hypothetical protein QZH41_019619 [Actinostola sp. cb2023]